MAKIGCKHLCFCKSGESTGTHLAGLVEANLTITNATGELYADNILWLSDSEFASGELAADIADLTLEQEALLFGATYTSGSKTLEAKAADTPAAGILGFVRSIVRRNASGVGEKKYQSVVFPNVKPARGSENASTKGSSIEYQTNPVTFTIMADANNKWKIVKEHDSEIAAIGEVNTQCGVTVSA